MEAVDKRWQEAWKAAVRTAPAAALQLTPLLRISGTWRVSSVERGQPAANFDLILDMLSYVIESPAQTLKDRCIHLESLHRSHRHPRTDLQDRRNDSTV